jgi:CheY-like chemotaxis protein
MATAETRRSRGMQREEHAYDVQVRKSGIPHVFRRRTLAFLSVSSESVEPHSSFGELQFRRALRTALVAKGYEVNDAGGGDEAFEKLHEEKYDVILLDINLPDIKGTDVCRTIRATSDVGIIMLTVRSNEADKVAALDNGANDYVTKPFSTPELFARIRRCCGATGSTGKCSDLA